MASTRVLQGASAPRSPEPTKTEYFATTPSPRKHIMIAHNAGTSRFNRSPIRKRPAGISAAQKQALIENLQLEITERARRLRAQYSLQAQSLRTRVEIRLNRIPVTLRKLTMAELLQRHIQQQERSAQIAAKIATGTTRSTAPVLGPGMKAVPSLSAAQTPPRRFKRTSDAMIGVDKENNDAPAQVVQLDNPKKRARGPTITAADSNAPVLSPTSSNSRMAPRSRPTSPVKVSASRAVSPVKSSRPNIISNMVEKAKTTRAAMTRKTTASTASTSSSTNSSTTSRTKRAAAPTSAPTPSRTTRRMSGESSSSSSTVARKTSRPGTAMSKSSASSSRGKTTTTASKKAAMAKATAAPKEAHKRVLRNRAT